MAENNFTNCQRCGNSIQVGDKFCGVCGATVAPVTTEDTQVVPRPAAATQGPPTRNVRRTLLLAGGIGVLLLLIGGGAMALLDSDGEETEIASGVYAIVPDGWTSPSFNDSEDFILPGETVMVPKEQRNLGDRLSISRESAVVHFEEKENPCGGSSPSGVTSNTDPKISGYNAVVSANATMADGKATVAGHPAEWTLEYFATASPFFLPNNNDGPSLLAAADYPAYTAGISLDVCVEKLDFNTQFWMSSEGPGEQPTATSNASVLQVREDARQDLRRRYDQHIEAALQTLESIDTRGWDGRTDLSEIPTSLDGMDEELSDPFDGELAKGSSVPEEPEVSEEEESTQPSETTSSSPTSERDQYEEFAREYDEASRNEDWEATYSMLYETSQSGVTDSQDEFTEEEWIEIHEALRDENSEPAPLDFVTVDQNDEATDSPARVTLYYEDDTQETITVIIPMAVASDDESGPQRFLTEEEVASLEDVASDTSSSGDPEEAVEETLRGHYEAIGDGDFEEAYSYFGPTFRSANSEESWIDEEEAQGIVGSTIHSVSVSSVDGDNAQAIVDVSFEDSSGSPNFLLEWSLVLEDGEWKLDELLDGEQISSKSEETSPEQTIPNFSELYSEDTNGGGV